jgi:hypothetical protein
MSLAFGLSQKKKSLAFGCVVEVSSVHSWNLRGKMLDQ